MSVPAKILQMATIEKPAYQWPDPDPLTEHTKATPYPMDALPGIIGEAIREVVEIVKCPAALAASSALSALAAVGQGVANIHPNQALARPSPLSLFTLTIGDSGERKTTADNFFAESLKNWCDLKTDELDADSKAYKSAVRAFDARKRGLEKAIEKASEKNNQEEVINLTEALQNIDQDEPNPIYVPSMIRDRATPQSIIDALKAYPSVGILSNEAGSFFGGNGMKPENLLGNLALINQGWDGNRITDSTRGLGNINLIGIRLTVGLAVQRAVLEEFHQKAGKVSRGSGFYARFLLSEPDSTQGTRFITVDECKGVVHKKTHLNLFYAKLHSLLDQQYDNGKGGRFENLPVLQLSDDALIHWVKYFNAVEKEIQAGGDMEDAKDIASKSADNAARLAGLFHLFIGGDVLDLISGDTMRAACRLASWHLYEARRFFGEIALPAADLESVKLDAWLISQCKTSNNNSVGRSYALQHSNLRKADKLNKALDTLERANRVRHVKEGKTAVIEINPALLEGVK